jgi:hypothetical protein
MCWSVCVGFRRLQPPPWQHDDRPGSTTLGQPRSSWIQTTEGKGWFPILRLYSPLQPYFDKSWGPSEIEAVKTNP